MPSLIQVLESKGKIKRGELRVLWESNKIPMSPLSVRKDLAPELKDRIRAAFIAIADVDPVLAKEMQITTQYTDFCYYPANDGMYDDLRKIARSQTKMRLID